MRQSDVMKLPDGMHAAGLNLFLFVRGQARSWVFRIKRNGRQIRRGLGSAHAVPLAEARAKAERLRLEIRAGRAETAAPKRITFAALYGEVIDAQERVRLWRNAKHAAQWRRTIEMYALPVLGRMPVAEITRHDVLRALAPIWQAKPETASRVRARIEAVMAYAIRAGYRADSNPAAWRGGLEFDLPSPRRLKPERHHAAPTVEELQGIAPRLMRSVSGRAVLFGILTAARVGEFVPARADEVDMALRVWSVPADRRKDGRRYPHRVPLASQALRLLETLTPVDGYLFPGKAGHCIHPETPRLMLIKALGRRVTMHGCRSTFRDWCAEQGVDAVLAEKSLMHATGNETEQAYQRSDLLERRRPIMQKWADVICNKV